MHSFRPAVRVGLAVLICFSQSLALGQSRSNDPSISGPVSQAELDRLKREIAETNRSSIEAMTEYHDESGDLNNRLDFWRYGGSLKLRLSSSASLSLRGTRTKYMTRESLFGGAGTNFSAGYGDRVSSRTQVQLEGGATRFDTDATTINAFAGVTFRPSDETTLYLTGARSNVEESLLSATGLRPTLGPFAGRLVGLVMDNRFVAGLSYQPLPGLDGFAEGGLGTRTGSSIDSNFFRHGRAGLGYEVIARPPKEKGITLLRASYQLNYFAFDKNLFGYGGASLLDRDGNTLSPIYLGSDGISPSATSAHGAVGGYFSPQSFVSHVARVDLQGTADFGFHYLISLFVGSQRYTASGPRVVSGVNGTLEIPLGDRVLLPITYARDNFGPFTQQSVLARLAVKF